jgi:hypothetical protein
MASERGLVISLPVRYSEESTGYVGIEVGGPLDLQELRFSLLFWDKLNYPVSNLINFALDGECEFLQKEGILKRLRTEFPNDQGMDTGKMAQEFVRSHVAAFRTLDRQEPGVWSLGVGVNSVSFPEADLEADRGILFSLHNCIPVPDKDVPLEHVLEFRARRHDELVTLRHHLEEIYDRIISAGDGELALNTQIEKLQVAIRDHLKVSRESRFKFRLVDFDASLNLPAAALAGWGGYMAGLPLLEDLILAGTAALALKIGPSLKKRDVANTPFEYISSFHKELF